MLCMCVTCVHMPRAQAEVGHLIEVLSTKLYVHQSRYSLHIIVNSMGYNGFY